jgi:hypothetical protein
MSSRVRRLRSASSISAWRSRASTLRSRLAQILVSTSSASFSAGLRSIGVRKLQPGSALGGHVSPDSQPQTPGLGGALMAIGARQRPPTLTNRCLAARNQPSQRQGVAASKRMKTDGTHHFHALREPVVTL